MHPVVLGFKLMREIESASVPSEEDAFSIQRMLCCHPLFFRQIRKGDFRCASGGATAS
jgi:hypothetical protein